MSIGHIWWKVRKFFKPTVLTIGVAASSLDSDTSVLKRTFGKREDVSIGFIYEPNKKQICMEAYLNGKMTRLYANQFVVQARMDKA